MRNRHFDVLFPITIIVAISFLVAWGLFRLLESSATLQGNWYQLGGGIAGFSFIFLMLRSWFDKLDTRRSEDLAVEIGRLSAVSVLKEGGNNIVALNTVYSDMRQQLCDRFENQDKHWLSTLLSEYHMETIRQARLLYPNLRQWEPDERLRATVIENID